MKNILIAGTARSGKSTLSSILFQEHKYSVFESDTLISTFQKVFPELKINHDMSEITKQNYAPFVNVLLKQMLKNLDYNNIPTAFCGEQFLPEKLFEFEQKDRYIIVFLGVSDITPKELFDNIRNHDKQTDWTIKLSDEKLLSLCKEVIEKSNFYKTECKKYGFKYFETGMNRNKAINDIIDYIKNENSIGV